MNKRFDGINANSNEKDSEKLQNILYEHVYYYEDVRVDARA